MTDLISYNNNNNNNVTFLDNIIRTTLPIITSTSIEELTSGLTTDVTPSLDDAELSISGSLTTFLTSTYLNYSDLNITRKLLFDCKDSYDPYDNMNIFDFWLSGVLLNIVGILGILGNIISMIILSRPQMRSSINYLLSGLAKCDVILILTSILLFGLPSVYPYNSYLFYYYYFIYPNISPVIYFIAMSAQTASVYLTLTITLERFVAVCHPLRARELCTRGRAKIYVIVIILFSLVYNLPRFWEVTIHKQLDNEHGTIFCVFVSELRSNNTYIKVYIQWLYLVFIYFIPFLSLALFNFFIYKQVRKANCERQRLSRSEKREIGLAIMLLCVVFVFFLCNVLALVINILEASYGIINDYFVKTSNLLVTINSSVNFIIYVIFGEKFKRIFFMLFCKSRIGRESPDNHDDSSYSNGDNTNRLSGRFQRVGTIRSSTRNGTSMRIKRSVRVPPTCVYYPTPIRPTSLTNTTTTSNLNTEWENEKLNGNNENGNGKSLVVTSGF